MADQIWKEYFILWMDTRCTCTPRSLSRCSTTWWGQKEGCASIRTQHTAETHGDGERGGGQWAREHPAAALCRDRNCTQCFGHSYKCCLQGCRAPAAMQKVVLAHFPSYLLLGLQDLFFHGVHKHGAPIVVHAEELDFLQRHIFIQLQPAKGTGHPATLCSGAAHGHGNALLPIAHPPAHPTAPTIALQMQPCCNASSLATHPAGTPRLRTALQLCIATGGMKC